jgi:Protein of unknown function (DUF2782)
MRMTAMKKPYLLVPLLLSLGACASLGERGAEADIPAGAVETVRTEANGDRITEYRVAGQLRIVKVQPPRGPAYYLQDRNGDGRPDDDKVSPVYFKLFEW